LSLSIQMIIKRILARLSLPIAILLVVIFHGSVQSYEQVQAADAVEKTKTTSFPQIRIVTLSPHLTEIVFALEKQQDLVAVSDYSDYPYPQGCIDSACSIKLPSLASYQGADIAAIVRLKPTIILAWEGGNKAQDIARLEQLGFNVFRSSPSNIQELMNEIIAIGKLLNAEKRSQALFEDMQKRMQDISENYNSPSISAIYYMNQQPLSGMGSDTWLNSLLSLCNISNIYEQLPTAYAQFSMADIIRKQPQLVIAATHQTAEQVHSFWAPHKNVFSPKVEVVNPDALHRFTPRVLPELVKLCQKVHL
jgi:vitamin B12 transport system substrate-binding protein